MDFEETILISVVIPTRNRPEEMKRLLNNLKSQTFPLNEIDIIIVDSSEKISVFEEATSMKFNNFTYVHSKVQSSAVQRNIGINLVSDTSEFIVFLDDDVSPSVDYITALLSLFQDLDIVGVSGIAVGQTKGEKKLTNWFAMTFKRIFSLYSDDQGSITAGGISMPVKFGSYELRKTSWLIGCAAWRRSAIGETCFETDFMGYSLGEDVIFSIKMSRKGTLITNPKLLLMHDESRRGRPSQKHFWKYWMVYRWRVCKLHNSSKIKGIFFYWWASLGQLLILMCFFVLRRETHRGSIGGMMIGALKVLGYKK